MHVTELRFDQVDQAYEHTLHWVYENLGLGLKTWLRNGQGLYWIKGKPGSGKSTLMKYIYNDRRTSDCLAHGESKKAKAAFFFHDRGLDLQKSFEGLLHGILYQVLEQIPGLVPSILDVYRRTGRGKWTLHSLQRALKAIQQQRILEVDICLFIDALDEYEGEHGEMANFLTDISTTHQSAITKIKVCFSSPPLDKFLDHFDPVPGFWMHDQTRGDILKLVHSRMKKNERMKPYLQSSDKHEQMYGERLSRTICDRAQGVFLWVKLVHDDLLDGLTAGDSIEQLDETLSAIPDDLEELYQRMLTKVDVKHRKESYIMLQIVHCSMRPLSLQEFTEAYLYTTALSITDRSPYLSPGEYKTEDMKRKIKSRCMGLIEIATSEFHGSTGAHRLSQSNDAGTRGLIVQLMHQTVKEYLQKSGIQSIFTDIPTGNDNNGYYIMLKYLLGMAVYWLANNDGPPISSDWLQDLISYARFAEQTTEQSQATLLCDFGDHRMLQLSQYARLTRVLGVPKFKSLLSFAAFVGLPLYLRERIGQ